MIKTGSIKRNARLSEYCAPCHFVIQKDRTVQFLSPYKRCVTFERYLIYPSGLS